MTTGADAAIARRAFRQIRVAATVWAAVFGVSAAASAWTYVSSFPDQASRQQLAAGVSGDVGAAILLGPIAAIDTVGGYTVYKSFVFLSTIGAVWGLLAATRLLRGEEDAGRWQQVLAGATRGGRATVATLVALGAAVGVIFAGVALIVLAAGRDRAVGFDAGDALYYGASTAVAPAVFAGVGAFTSQLGRSRRMATGLGMAVFAAAFVVRMIADSAPGTRWALWLTPFGWIERTRPLTDPDWRPLVVAAVVVVALTMSAVTLASRRDVGSGAFGSRDVSATRPFGLRSPVGLAARLELPVLVAWCVGAAAAASAFGIVGRIATGAVPSSIRDTLGKFGAHGSLLRQYFGVVYLFVATIVAVLPAGQVAALAEEETAGRLVPLLVLPVSRRSLLAGRLALAASAVVAAAAVAGLAGWCGAASQGLDVSFGTMLGTGLNVIPTALLVLGIGALVYAVAPRAAAPVAAGVVIGSLLIDLVGSLVPHLAWLQHLSLFHFMALAPAQPVEAANVAVTLVVALALGVTATFLFGRRDLRPV